MCDIKLKRVTKGQNIVKFEHQVAWVRGIYLFCVWTYENFPILWMNETANNCWKYSQKLLSLFFYFFIYLFIFILFIYFLGGGEGCAASSSDRPVFLNCWKLLILFLK